MTKEEFKEIVDKAIFSYAIDEGKVFPQDSDYDWCEMIDVLISHARTNVSLVSFCPWRTDDYFAFYWSNNLSTSIILSHDATLEWKNYDELVENWWYHQKEVDVYEDKIFSRQKQKSFIIETIKRTIKAIKPWKKNNTTTVKGSSEYCYNSGWNTCIAEITKQSKIITKKMDKEL